MLGAEGLGLYQISLSMLGLFMTITSSGIPVTVSRMMIKNKSLGCTDQNGGVVTSGIILSIAVSLPLTVLVLTGSPVMNFLFSDNRCSLILSVMIPGLIFTSVYAVIRGAFWGNTDFVTYSVIELAEEAVMMIAGIILVNRSVGMLDGAAKAGLAVLISYLFSFTVALIVFFAKKGRLGKPKGSLKPLIASSAPVTAMRTGTALVNTLVAILLPARLVFYGMASNDAIGSFGKVVGMAMPLITMPSTLIGSLAVVLVPELSANYYSGKFITLKNNMEKALNFSCFTACMIIPVFIACGREIGVFLYSDSEVGVFIIKSAVIMFPLSVSLITSSMLNSLNREKRTLLNFIYGAAALIVCIYFLPAVIDINAIIVGTLFSYAISAALNLRLIGKISAEKPDYISYYVKSCIFVIPSSLFGVFIRNILTGRLSLITILIMCVCAVIAFQFMLFYVFGMTGLPFNRRQKKRLKGFNSKRSGTVIKRSA